MCIDITQYGREAVTTLSASDIELLLALVECSPILNLANPWHAQLYGQLLIARGPVQLDHTIMRVVRTDEPQGMGDK